MCVCYICQKGLDEVKLDPRDLKPTPCTECESIIQECLEEMGVKQEDDDEINVAYIETTIDELEYNEEPRDHDLEYTER